MSMTALLVGGPIALSLIPTKKGKDMNAKKCKKLRKQMNAVQMADFKTVTAVNGNKVNSKMSRRYHYQQAKRL